MIAKRLKQRFRKAQQLAPNRLRAILDGLWPAYEQAMRCLAER